MPVRLPPRDGEARQRERIPTEVFRDADEAAASVADEIAALITRNRAANRPTVLGLATGSTPVRLYRHLARLHRDAGLSFRDVITFNLDEYYGLPPNHPESYRRFMQDQLFDLVDIPPHQTHIPDGTVPRGEVYDSCASYERAIRAAGGIDLQVLGIGRTGHIGFNEPGATRESRTRLVTLDALTRRDAARDFQGEAKVPRHAVTMGVATILEARSIVLLAWGEAKAEVVARAVEEPPAESLPASLLQGHPAVSFVVDPAAASALTRVRRSWLVGAASWDPRLVRRAVVWLSLQRQKPVLKLLDEDYAEHGLADLLAESGPAYDLNVRLFNELQHTITGWPGGKPDAPDAHRPERATPFPKRILVLSPEPSHDVIGMGGTLRRLAQQGHEVVVAYQTSGNLAVPDEEVAAAAEVITEVASGIGRTDEPAAAAAAEIRRLLEWRPLFEPDPPTLRQFKALLRRSEARAALRACGVPAGAIRFLDLPFYEKGRYRQFAPGGTDAAVMEALLRELAPHQVFATGAGDDPASVTAVCFRLLADACRTLRSEPWYSGCRVWLYAGGAAGLEPAEVDMAVPLSPGELAEKRAAIFHHRTQRAQTPAPASASEPWQQAEDSNRALAENYDRLGLADYEGIEGFRRWDF